MGAWRASGARAVCLLVLWLAAASTVRVHHRQDPAAPDPTPRLEGEAILALADAALMGRAVPDDLGIQWHNEFLKAQRGTFIPFTVTIDASLLTRPDVLVYVRAVRQDRAPTPSRRDRIRAPTALPPRERPEVPGPEEFPVDAIFPVELEVEPGQRARVSRGFSVAPGRYDIIVVVRERETQEGASPRAAVLVRPLEVPDFEDDLTTSTLILADRLEILDRGVEPEALPERPYVIGRHAITPAADRIFRRSEELLVVFLIYNPFVTTEKKFDLEVEYHFFRRGGGPAGAARQAGSPPPAEEGERYFNRTEPQRFNPATLGSQFDPGAGNPVMAGQGVPLAGFEAGEYRLAIRITDLLAGKSIMRDVRFTVGS